MRRWKARIAITAAALCAALLLALAPHWRYALTLIDAAGDPARLADVQIEETLRRDPEALANQAEAALAAGDADLAGSFIDLADHKAAAIPDALRGRVAAAQADAASATHYARGFASGLVTGEVEDGASLAGTVAGDLFVFGDIRDAAREGWRLARGEEADTLILGLAGAGLALTAATYASVGTAAPARAGLTLIKDARKLGSLGNGLTRWAGRAARDVVDAPALRQGEAAAALRVAIRTDRAGDLVRVAKDAGRIGDKVGTRGALDALRVAEGPKDVARAARLAEAKGGQTRAILKTLGRGALLLTLAAFNVSWWLVWVAMAAFGLLASIKAGAERMTERMIARRRAGRLRGAETATPSPQLAPARLRG